MVGPSSSPRAVLLALALTLAAGAASAAPNIVVILTDDLGYSDLGCYGGEIETPNLDRLARHGVRFTQFYVTPRCSPTRAALLTGMYPHEVGIGHLNEAWGRPGYRGELSRQAPTLAEVLRAAGYRTYMSGKWHLSHNPKRLSRDAAQPSPEQRLGWPRARGFDRVFGTIRGSGSFYEPASLIRDDRFIEVDRGFYYTDAISVEAARFIREHCLEYPSRPFFIYLSYSSPHWPLHAPEEAVREYASRYDAGWDVLRRERYRRMVAMGILDAGWGLAPREPRAAAWTEEKRKAWQARRMETYAAMVERMDRGIGEVVEALAAVRALDDTLVVFLSDNGANGEQFTGINRLGAFILPMPRANRWRFGDRPDLMPGPAETFQTYGPGWSSLSNTPFRRGKHWTHEGGIATPLIVHWPQGLGVEPGSLVRAPGHVVDLLPTFLAASGAAYPAAFGGAATQPLRGESLMPLLTGASRRRGPMFWEHEGNRGVRDGRWKLVADWPGSWELYDMRADRTELHDLAAEQPQRVAALAEMYDDFAAATRVGPWPWVSRRFRLAVWGCGIAAVAAVAFWRWRRSRRQAA